MCVHALFIRRWLITPLSATLVCLYILKQSSECVWSSFARKFWIPWFLYKPLQAILCFFTCKSNYRTWNESTVLERCPAQSKHRIVRWYYSLGSGDGGSSLAPPFSSSVTMNKDISMPRFHCEMGILIVPITLLRLFPWKKLIHVNI